MRALLAAIALLAASTAFVPAAAAQEECEPAHLTDIHYTVGTFDSPVHYATLQEAADAALPGQTIHGHSEVEGCGSVRISFVAYNAGPDFNAANMTEANGNVQDRTAGPVSFQADKPACFYRIDLYYGGFYRGPGVQTFPVNFSYEDEGRLIDRAEGGPVGGVCTELPPTPPVTPTPPVDIPVFPSPLALAAGASLALLGVVAILRRKTE